MVFSPADTNSLGQGMVVSRAQFLALVAGRLAALPAPFPDLAVFVVGLAGLPAFHQAFGRAAADRLVEQTFAAIRRFDPDTVMTRLSDNEVALTHELDDEWGSLEEAASDLRAQVAEANGRSHLSLIVPPNIGAALQRGPPGRGESLECAGELVRKASLAVHIAARSNAAGFVLYSAAEDSRIRNSALLDQELRQAAARNEFLAHYQPLVDLRNYEIVSLEALVRWRDPSGRLRGPGEFIDAAEATGIVVQIGTAMLGLAMRQAAAWAEAGWTPPRIAVNVSAAQLQDPAFRQVVIDAVSIPSVSPGSLELEMTERTFITWSNSTRRTLDEFREMGITLALDDFGTGYSSLQYLKDLPFSKLKIDKAFVENIASDRRDAALIRTIVGLGEALGLQVVAEGVETVVQAEMLLDCGCGVMQGYLFSRPLPPADVPALVPMFAERFRDLPLQPGHSFWGVR